MENFAKKLASSDGTTREKAFKVLKSWIKERGAELNENEYLRLWKALFYCLWMTDKPANQQKLAIQLGDLWLELDAVNRAAAQLYVDSFWQTICREWPKIDRYRLDKFYFLLKRFVMGAYEIMQRAEWKVEDIKRMNEVLSAWPLHPSRVEVPDSFRANALDVFPAVLKELNYQFGDAQRTVTIVSPYIRLAVSSTKPSILKACEKFFDAMQQHSQGKADVGKAAFEAGESADVHAKNRALLYNSGQKLQKMQ